MKSIALPLFFALFTPFLSAQILDDFTDGNLDQNPAWTGAATSFKITAGELQLNAPSAGNSELSVQGNIPDSAVWQLDFRLEFSPSTSNLLRIYLLSDQSTLTAGNGYFLEIGENGTADALRLFRQDLGAKTLLASGTAGLAGGDPVSISLKMKRTAAGQWTLEAGPKGQALQFQCTVGDNAYSGGNGKFFGFYCLYTETRKDKFFFDNIRIQADLPDTQGPELLSVQAVSATAVDAVFNEAIEPSSAVASGNYSGVPGLSSFTLDADGRTVHLGLSAPLTSGSYTLNVKDVKDLAGNKMADKSLSFNYVEIGTSGEFDLLINEIYPDPTPSIGLPEAEWIELYNRSTKAFNLADFTLQEGASSPASLPAYVLEPGAYVVLTNALNTAAMAGAGITNVVAVPIAATALNNTGDELVLRKTDGSVIDRVNYSIDWYGDPAKDDGGWSLERVNPFAPCLGAENWQACAQLPGGTPGKQNSVFSNSPDQTGPALISAFPTTDLTILLTFSEGLQADGAENPANYQISPALSIVSAALSPANRNEVSITLTQPLQAGQLYDLTFGTGIADCSGNAILAGQTLKIGLPQQPEPLDIVVNEILFNPPSGGARYVEFYNRSGKIFNWAEFYIANFEKADIVPAQLNRLFLPGEYAVFGPDLNFIKNGYRNIEPNRLIELDLPSLDDKSGNISIYWSKNGEEAVVDSFDYDENLHNGLYSVSERDGVALERINPEGPTNSAGNWTSAASNITGAPGTPTLPNSQLVAGGPAGSGIIELPRTRFSPDLDGYEDYLEIAYAPPREGYAATISIYDSEGILVKRLVRQELIGTRGTLRWDGDLDNGAVARPGIYVLLAEVFDPAGDVVKEKHAISVVRKW